MAAHLQRYAPEELVTIPYHILGTALQIGPQHGATFRSTGNKRQENGALAMSMEGPALLPTMGINHLAVYVYHNDVTSLATASLQEMLHSEGSRKTAQARKGASARQHAHQTRDARL